MRRFPLSTARASLAMCFTLIVSGMLIPSALFGQTWTWHSAGMLPSTGLCGYFWDEQTGAVATLDQFFYTRDGVTWLPSQTMASDAHIFSIRCFDGKTLYAAVSRRYVDECWSSSDSGITWTLIQSIARFKAEEVDVYWNGSPVLVPESVARLDATRLVMSADDFTNAVAQYSQDGGQTWAKSYTTPPSGWTGGFSSYADTLHHIFYIGSEDGQNPMMLQSPDFGVTWYPTSAMPTSSWIDDIEGVGGRMYFQNVHGVFTTTNRGATWDSIGGPHRTGNFDDTRFCVYGCGGLTVTVFDDSGGVWTSTANVSPAIHSTFATTAAECASSTLSIAVDSFFVTGRMLIKLYGDTSGAFQLIGLDTVSANSGSIRISIRFLPKDLLKHTDSIAIIPLDFPCAPTIVHAFTGQATFVPAVANAPKAAASCAGGMASVLFTNPGCEVLHITSATSAWAGLSILPFDSLVVNADTIPLGIVPATFSGEQSYFIHLKGYYEPSGTPFDTSVEVAITFSHNVSTLGTSATTLNFVAPAPCVSWDTTIILRNTGCDTLTVSRVTMISSYAWQIFPDLSKKVLYPGEVDTLFIHFASKIPGAYPERLVYSFTGRDSGGTPALQGLDTISLDATVPKAGPALSLLPGAVALGNRSFCQSDTEIIVQITNLSCDSMILINAHLSNSDGFTLIASNFILLPPEGVQSLTLTFAPNAHGLATDTLFLHHVNIDGPAAGDTMIVLTASVIRGPALLASLDPSLDAGATSICEERDTFVVIQDTGCDSLCVSQIATSTPEFVLAPNEPTAFCLGPGDRDTVHLLTQVDTTGGGTLNTSSLEITSDADNTLAPILLAREIEYPPLWELTLSPPDSAEAGGSVTYQIIQHGALPPDDTSVDFQLVFYDDLLSLDGVDESWTHRLNYYRSADGDAHYYFHISPVPTDSILATLHFTAYQARILSTQLSLDSIRFASNPSRPSDCIASAMPANSEFRVRTSCGGPLLSEALNGLLTIDGISPNPTTGEVSLRYTLRGASENGSIELEDALGRTVLEQTASLLPGQDQSITLDLSALPKGMYLARIAGGDACATRQIIRQ
ncbi:MAG TPA: T9SS type A sorting domain-containing protein [Candidatus Kapabacteria bacterium]|nr:T9SS type A sorting domain-containing protein [Candidatus Kapabacteria bacterium]